jgi:ribosomal-protein-alanine N-acetyltransferase
MPDGTSWLQTPRLALQRFTPDDLVFLTALFGDPDVARYVGGLKDSAATKTFLGTRVLQYYDEHPGLGVWATIERATGLTIGYHLLNHIQGEAIIQVGYGLVKSAWGRGFATEGASAILRYGFDTLHLPRIAGIANVANVASQRVLTKIGLERRGERAFAHPAYAGDGAMAWFEIERDLWLSTSYDSTRRLT